MKGKNWLSPLLYIFLYKAGFVSLKPTIIRIPARQDSGIICSTFGIRKKVRSRITPCEMVDALVRAPLLMFVELRTITEVTGSPPKMPETKLAVP
jgi:hypothetical protein